MTESPSEVPVTADILARIAASTRADLAERQRDIPVAVLIDRAAAAPDPRPFRDALTPRPGGPARLVAEIKRASPSKGLIAEHFDPVAQAQAYQRGGAAAISVLTEPHFFGGSLDHLRAVREAVILPVLRKDFILDPYQIYEARAAGADAVLLICALLDDATLGSLLALAHNLGMEALVEAHDAAEVARAVRADASVIGVNSRDLRTFHVDPEVVRHLRPHVPRDRRFVAESGIADCLGAARARAWGADAILAGEALMRAADPAAKVRELAYAPGGVTAAFFAQLPFIKLCGLAQPEQVMLADQLGADAFGLVFAPSRRRVTLSQAARLMAAAADTEGIRAVGVFVNEPAPVVEQITTTLALDAVQLAGDETPEQCAEVAALAHVPVIKTLRLSSEDDLSTLDAYASADVIPLLDTPSAGSYGGTGETGDWALARRAAERWPLILSGGLAPANVAQALQSAHPMGVDVSSGIETDHVKDPQKMRAFVQTARTGHHQ